MTWKQASTFALCVLLLSTLACGAKKMDERIAAKEKVTKEIVSKESTIEEIVTEETVTEETMTEEMVIEEAVAEEPTTADTGSAEPTAAELFAQVEALLADQKLDEGMARLDELLELHPQHMQGLATRIYINVMVKDNIEQVLADLPVAATVHETPIEFYAGVAALYVQREKFEEASRIAYAVPQDLPPTFNLVLMRGIALEKTQDAAAAIGDYEKAATMDPTNEHVWSILASARFELGNVDGAMTAIDKLLEINPTSHEAYATRSNFHGQMGNHQKALGDIEMALMLTKGDRGNEAYYTGRMAFVYQDMKNREKACEAARAARDLGDSTAMMLLDYACPLQLKNIPCPPGTKLHYEVDFFGKSQFDVEVVEFSQDQIAFNWSMSTSEDMKGSITMTKKALATAHAQHNYFDAGEELTYDDKTSVWVSHEVYQQLKAGKKVEIDTGKGVKQFQFGEKAEYLFDFGGEGAAIPVFVALTEVTPDPDVEVKPYKLWILDSPENPLVVQMDLGWTVTLHGVTPVPEMDETPVDETPGESAGN